MNITSEFLSSQLSQVKRATLLERTFGYNWISFGSLKKIVDRFKDKNYGGKFMDRDASKCVCVGGGGSGEWGGECENTSLLPITTL